ncbi:hypothetical protein PYK79_11310 [Streptomyces sp. ID05-04B]|uniref:hypothetical protein n=1 Tax=Streptomyces sp. ID05-04B TaxID=3028661 RepID=UPI0029C348A8|nr:hypothetical protein [Streptomyces sp. ID05-04B]MDX5563841.1 hypothetical protein [Streptomyces sp. ID05-04B]
MLPWIMFSVILIAPFVVGATLAVRTTRRANKADRAMRLLAQRPGWSRVAGDARKQHSTRFAGHFPWLLRTLYGTAVTGSLGGHPVTVSRLWEPVGRRDVRHWLVVCFDVPGDGLFLRLEREWSAAELNLRCEGLPYLPMGKDQAGTVERFYSSGLPEQLMRFAAPAVSLYEAGVCFVYPMPDVVDMGSLLKGLAALLPDLTELARAAGPKEPQDAP